MDHGSQTPKNSPIIFVIAGLAIIALVVLVISISRDTSEPEDTGGQDQTSQETSTSNEDEDKDEDKDEDGAGEEEKDDDGGNEEESAGHDQDGNTDPEADPIETVTLIDGLPSDWHELSSTEKIALNPFDCPADENNIVHLSSETGQCLETDADDGEDNNNDNNTGIRVNVPDDALVVSLGDPFAYAADSELTVTGMSCTNLEFVTLETIYDVERLLTIGQILDKHGADYVAYKDDRAAWEQYHFDLVPPERLYYTDYLPYLEHNYGYLQNLESWLSENDIPVAANLRDQLFNYLDCRFSISLLNTGQTRQFAHDCPVWEFDGNFDLVGEKRDYSQANHVRLDPEPTDCTEETLDFLIGEVIEDGFIPFIVNSDDQILEVIIRSTDDTFRVVIER